MEFVCWRFDFLAIDVSGVVKWLSLFCCGVIGSALHVACEAATPGFERIVLSEEFHSEGAHFADFNGDGHHDIVSGPYWYEGPGFRQRHRYTAGDRHSIKGYSDHFFSFTHDFNADGRPDILTIGMPGEPAHWSQNPGTESEHWERHQVLEDVGNESPTLTDLDGDGKPELVLVHGGAFGYAVPNWDQPTAPWKFHGISTTGSFGRFTHGLGVADVDGDGRLDVLQTNGWHRQTGKPTNFVFHAQRFAQSGGAQMFAYDFDGDGDQDVVSVQNAHGWGLHWYERRGKGDDYLWVEHRILSDRADHHPDGIAISQMHGLALADIDGDGVKDLVTGKRFFAHGGGDPGAYQLPVLYWFRTRRKPNGQVEFEPHLIDQRVGVGTQLTVGDVDQDGDPDVLIGNKLGTFLLRNQGVHAKQALVSSNLAGTKDFAGGVRASEPKTPQQELASFVLPPGFEVELVAAEPLIAKPLNMAFDARGRLWVTDSLEYPYAVETGKPGRDSVKVLEDLDGDGAADKVVTFADGLNIPIGLYPYLDGVICYSIPNIWFLRDTDGDGVCDVRERLFGPFDHTRDTHGMCNAFTRGYDGWLYACHGFNNQSTVAGTDGHSVTMHSGNTFRMRLDGRRIEHYTHGQVNPFGMSYDARGDLLTADCHTKPVTLLMRNGFYESFGTPHDGLGFVPNVMDHLHGSTAIGGIAIQTTRAFPAEYQHNTFGGNVMTSRINRNSLRYVGSSVQAQEEPDFLISGDSWFRPVDLQFGPDGALYVADFYNRIIGHYEVPLTHPGRDRHRGRIWRIVYNGEDGRTTRDTPARLASGDRVDRSTAELVADLAHPNPVVAKAAADQLADVHGRAAIPQVRTSWQRSSSPQARWQAMWILFRLQALAAQDIQLGIRDEDEIVRAHCQRVLAEWDHESVYASIRIGLRDGSALVRRAAADAAGQRVAEDLVPELVQAVSEAAAEDVHLRHALRIALRNQLRVKDRLRTVLSDVHPNHVSLFAGVCLAIDDPYAAKFVLDHISQLATNQNELLEYAQFAARNAGVESIQQLVTFARKTYESDNTLQMQLLAAIREAVLQKGEPLPASVIDWATALAEQLLAVESSDSPVAWQDVPLPGVPTHDATTYRLSVARRSSDGLSATPLWSSFPSGEQRTGIYRSGSFPLDDEFSFYLAGHDGFPQQALQRRNFVRLRDSRSHAILKTWAAPRNDVAQRNVWRAGEMAGRDVYVEIVDGDSANAFAWIAAGRFSERRLNPSDVAENRRLAAQLIVDYGVNSLQTQLMRLIRATTTDRQTRGRLAEALVAGEKNSLLRATAIVLTFEGLSPTHQAQAIEGLYQGRVTQEFLGKALGVAAELEQQRLADRLTQDASGCQTLVALCDAGHASVELLRNPKVASNISAVASQDVQQRMELLLASLPPENEGVAKVVEERIASFLSRGGDAGMGQTLFQKQCAVCHQIAGQGKQVGPNLDGIGQRGLTRLAEDVLAPNRNVDVAFRATTIVTDEGQVMTGLARPDVGNQVKIVDATGKELSLAKDRILRRTTSRISPMPTNFSQVLSDQEWRDLMSYLLQVR